MNMAFLIVVFPNFLFILLITHKGPLKFLNFLQLKKRLAK